jgi:hypothetical protein
MTTREVRDPGDNFLGISFAESALGVQLRLHLCCQGDLQWCAPDSSEAGE